MKPVKVIALSVALLLLVPLFANAQVAVQRKGDENPAISVTKSIFWGGLGGLILGGAAALVAEDNEGDIIKWSFVGGTFAGLGLGIWHVTHRPEPRAALLRIGPEGVDLSAPAVEFAMERDRLPLDGAADRTIRVTLLSVR